MAAANNDHAEQAYAITPELKSTQEYQVLNEYLQGQTHDVSQAQDKFCEPVEDKFKSGADSDEVQGLLWKAWGIVTSLAAQTPHGSDQQKLVDFVLGLASRPKVQKGDTVCKVWDLTVWSDLPVFGAQMRERWDFDTSSASSEQEKARWLNLNGFAAVLTQKAHERKIGSADFSLYAIWTFRQALEDGKQPAEVSVEATALWLKYAAATIYELSQQNKSFDGKLARSGPLFKEKEWTGFSTERWRAWSSRLSDLQDQKLGQHCEQQVTEARKTMGEHLER